jgi:tRNA threonylcarbamoyladenosine biosynthesis protein TsaB
MNVLGIETATLVCGAAAVVDANIRADVWVEEENVHAEHLMMLIGTALEKARLSVEELDGIAVSIGPGSFTGLRIGASIAKGLAFARGTPIVAVPTLASLAERIVHSGSCPEHAILLPVLDARRDEVYCQLFEVRSGRAIPISEPRDVNVARLTDLVDSREVLVTGEAAARVVAMQSSTGLAGPGWHCADPALRRCSAGMIAVIGEAMLQRGETIPVADIEPQYIKEFYFRQRQQQ